MRPRRTAPLEGARLRLRLRLHLPPNPRRGSASASSIGLQADLSAHADEVAFDPWGSGI